MEDKIIVYRTYYNPIEANIVKAKLEDSNIPCFLTDENIATIQPMYNQAVGGVKLNVFEKDVAQIDAFLADTNEDLLAEEEVVLNDITCEECGSNNASYGQATKERFSWWVTLLSLVLFVYPFKANQCYHCYQCGNEFK